MGADLWTVFQQPDQRRDATMQAVRTDDRPEAGAENCWMAPCSSHGLLTANCMGLTILTSHMSQS